MKDLIALKQEYNRNKEILDSIKDNDLNIISDKYNLSTTKLNYILKNYDSIQTRLLKRINFIEEICKEFQKGRTLENISKDYNTTRQNINRIISLGNINRYDGGINKKKNNRISIIKNLVDANKSLEFIMKELSLSEYTIRKDCNDNDIEILTENQIKFNKLKKEILNLRSLGKSQSEISTLLKVSQSYVSKVLLSENQRTYLTSEEILKRNNLIFDDFCNGCNYSYLSKKYNMSVSNICRILKID